MSAPSHEYRRAREAFEEARNDPSIRHFVTAEHLANERTHVSYMTTAISLLSLGITVNRLDYQPERLLAEGLTLTSLLAAALGIIWIFLR